MSTWYELRPRRLTGMMMSRPSAFSRPRTVLTRLVRDWTEGLPWRSLALVLSLTAALMAWLAYRSLWRPAWPLALPGVLLELLELAEVAGALTLAGLWILLAFRLRYPARAQGDVLGVLTAEEMYALSPADFETYVAGLFRRKGHDVRHRGRSGDLGVDLEVVDGQGRRAIVQCKRYQNTVGAEVVRELYGTFMHEEAVHAYLVTTGEISEAAREWARGKPLTLIDGAALAGIALALAR